MSLETAMVLDCAADLVEFGGHIKGQFARTALGTACTPSSPQAAVFCAAGAIWAAECVLGVSSAIGGDGEAAYQRLQATLRRSMADWNDAKRTHVSHVISRLRKVARKIGRETGVER